MPEPAIPTGLLLAAGRGSRFDATGSTLKLLQPLADGRPIALATAQAMRAALPQVLALVAPDTSENSRRLAQLLQEAGCTVLPCPAADAGMGSTLASGVAATQQACGWLVMLADMPLVAASTIAAVRDSLIAGASIARPEYHGQPGHPVGFAAICRAELLALQGDVGARPLLARFPVTSLLSDDPGCVWDIDRPEDLAGVAAAFLDDGQRNPHGLSG